MCRVKTGEYSLKHAYDFYKKKFPKGHKNYVDKKTYLKVCYLYNKEISRLMIAEGEKIHLPFALSYLRVAKFKMSFQDDYLEIDYGYLKNFGKVSYMLNEHSDDYRAYFFWQKEKVIVKNKNYYRFVPTRDNKRFLAKMMKDGDLGHRRYTERDKKFKL